MKNPNRFFPKLFTLIILTSLFLLPVFQTQAETSVIPTKWVTNALKAVKLADLLNDANKLGNAAKLLNRSQSVGELKDALKTIEGIRDLPDQLLTQYANELAGLAKAKDKTGAERKLKEVAKIVGKVTTQTGEILYRGGNNFDGFAGGLRTKDGLVQSGYSLNTNYLDTNVIRKGGAHTLDKLPEGLKIEQKGSVGHYELKPINESMPVYDYQKLVDQIKLTPIQ